MSSLCLVTHALFHINKYSFCDLIIRDTVLSKADRRGRYYRVLSIGGETGTQLFVLGRCAASKNAGPQTQVLTRVLL